MKLLLFDIDGTLLTTHGLGRRVVVDALSAVCGRPITTDGVVFSGRTDPQILRDVLRGSGLDEPEAASLLPHALAAYTEVLRERLRPHHVEVLPGVRALLDRLAEQETVRLGLLTGNAETTAYLKLEAAGLATHFPFGAFGSDHADRHRLPPVAVQRAQVHTGRAFSGKDVVIIGDTEHDLHCGRGIGAFAVGVCTGRYGREELLPHGPDVLLDDLSDAEFFVRSVLHEGSDE